MKVFAIVNEVITDQFIFYVFAFARYSHIEVNCHRYRAMAFNVKPLYIHARTKAHKRGNMHNNMKKHDQDKRGKICLLIETSVSWLFCFVVYCK